MALAAVAAVVLVAVLHVAFFALESVLWTTPKVRKIFGNSAEKAEITKVLAQNQGAYNLGLSALLLWLQFSGNQPGVLGVLLFIVAMGLVGGFTASRSIIVLQALPAAAAFGLTWMAG